MAPPAGIAQQPQGDGLLNTKPEIHLHHGDLPAGLDFGDSVAVDSETMGLRLKRDRLCLVQLRGRGGDIHLVKFERDRHDAPNLKALLEDPAVLKIFHFARFDIAAFKAWLGADTTPVFCTKIASKLTRTYTDRHGLKDCCKELLKIDLSKEQQSSDWGAPDLNEAQMGYAASDVLHLHDLMDIFYTRLDREGRREIAEACFRFLPTRAELDLLAWEDTDIFAHS